MEHSLACILCNTATCAQTWKNSEAARGCSPRCRISKMPAASPKWTVWTKGGRQSERSLDVGWFPGLSSLAPPASPLQMFSLSFCQPSWLTLWLIPQGVVVKQVWQMLHKSRWKMAFSWLNNFSFRLFLNDLFSSSKYESYQAHCKKKKKIGKCRWATKQMAEITVTSSTR